MINPEHTKLFSQKKTPFFFYDLDLLHSTLDALQLEAGKYGYLVHYAIKANANPRILKLISDKELGADCVSGNEIKAAVNAGFKTSEIAFAGVGKSDEEINCGLENDIFCFNCESLQELQVIDQLAKNQNKIARIALRINPDVNPNTHHYITTGLEENKFGINAWEFDAVVDLLQSLDNLKLTGLHFHIGSQISDLSTFKNLCTRINQIQQWFFNRRIIVEHINAGGGLGINYEDPANHSIPDFGAYFKVFDDFLELRPHQNLHFELGRAVIAQCGSLISKVLYIKEGLKTNFAILDAGMTELIRPALYQSYHKICNISKNGAAPEKKYDVAGPICESSDCFGKAVELPETERGDLMAILSAGAYGEVMGSSYNLREKAGSVFSDELEPVS